MTQHNTAQPMDITDVMATDINATIFTEDELKAVALAKHLDIDKEDVQQLKYDDCVFDVVGVRYRVCTDEEANEIAAVKVIGKMILKAIPKAILMQSILRRESPDDEEITETDIHDRIIKRGRAKLLEAYDGKEYTSNGFYIYQLSKPLSFFQSVIATPEINITIETESEA